MARQILVQIVACWTPADVASNYFSPVEHRLQAGGHDEPHGPSWRVVWTQTIIGMSRAEIMDFVDLHRSAGRTITITEAWLQPPFVNQIYWLQ